MAFDTLVAQLYLSSMLRLIGPYLLFAALAFVALGRLSWFRRLPRPTALALRIALAALLGMVLLTVSYRFLPL